MATTRNPRRNTNCLVTRQEKAIQKADIQGTKEATISHHHDGSQARPNHRLQPAAAISQTDRRRIRVVSVQRWSRHVVIGVDQVDQVPMVRVAWDRGQGPGRPGAGVEELAVA